LKILVAEDEPEILRHYKILLENEGHEVITARDGEECVGAYRRALQNIKSGGTPFNLVILDHRMPKKTGLDVANEILEVSPAQEILMITAYSGELDLRDNLQKMKIMKKPFEVDDLVSYVSKLARQ
jgi:two-component system cell cycle response regulator CpdR